MVRPYYNTIVRLEHSATATLGTLMNNFRKLIPRDFAIFYTTFIKVFIGITPVYCIDDIRLVDSICTVVFDATYLFTPQWSPHTGCAQCQCQGQGQRSRDTVMFVIQM